MIQQYIQGTPVHAYEVLDYIVAPHNSLLDSGITVDGSVIIDFTMYTADTEAGRSPRFFSSNDPESWADPGTWGLQLEGGNTLAIKALGESSNVRNSNITMNEIGSRKLRYHITATGYLDIYDDTDTLYNSFDVSSYTNSSYTSQSNINLFGLAANYQESVWEGSRLYGVKIWKNNTLVREYIPVKRLSDNAYGFYESVNQEFKTNEISGYNFSGVSKSVPEYIDEGTPGSTQYINNIIKYTTVKTPIYELVEEIHNVAQTTPQSYFDTDYIPQSDTEIELRFKGSSDNTGHQRLYYVKLQPWNATDQWQVDFEGNNKVLTYKFNNNGGQYVQTNISMDSTTIHTIKHNNSSLYYDDTEIATHSANFYQGNQSWLIGATLSDPSEQGLFNFYYVTIRESGQDVHRWLPAKRLSDDVLGLYDEVDGTFTAWTGTAGYTSKSTPEYIYGETQGYAHINRIYLGNKIYWGNDEKIPSIPQQYIVVDYIRSVGSSDTNMSYINTGWRCSNNTVFEYKIVLPSDRTVYTRYSNVLPYGAHTWTSTSTKTDGELSFAIMMQNSDLRFLGSRNINDYDNEVTWSNVHSYGLNDGTRHEIIATISTSSFDITVDNNNSVLTPASGPWSGLDGTNNTISELYLFTGQWPVRGSSMNEPLEPASFVTQEMYYFKIYDNGTLVRDYVPVYDTVSQKYGLYDKVNGTFNTSQNNNYNFTGSAI